MNLHEYVQTHNTHNTHKIRREEQNEIIIFNHFILPICFYCYLLRFAIHFRSTCKHMMGLR